jgi:hypothetical protein
VLLKDKTGDDWDNIYDSRYFKLHVNINVVSVGCTRRHGKEKGWSDSIHQARGGDD